MNLRTASPAVTVLLRGGGRATRAAALLGAAALALSATLPATSARTAGGTTPLGRVALAAATPIPSAFAQLLSGDLSTYQWSLAATHTPPAWSKATGAGVIVGVIDTGIDATRPDLAGRVLPGAHLDPVTLNIVAGSRPDHYSHGTHVAGIIAGSNDGHGISGVAPGAKLLPINLDTGTDFGGVEVAAAMSWAVDHGAKVLNLSLGFLNLAASAADAGPICDAVTYANSKGVVVVASAGNDGDYGSIPSAPASCPGAISVAAVDHNLKITTWSSYDGTVSVAAPGAGIYSTVPITTDATGFASYSGTSMSAPFVAGLAALLVQQHPNWTPAQIKTRIQNTAQDAGAPGTDLVYGHGIVDPSAAVGATAPAPEPVEYFESWAYPFWSTPGGPSSTPPDENLVTWRPLDTTKVTGYTVTEYTAAGVHRVNIGDEFARYESPVVAGGFQVTAHTSGGDVVSAPIWSDPNFFDSIPQVLPATHLTAAWRTNGSLVVKWTLPAVDLERADFGFLSVSSDGNFGKFGLSGYFKDFIVKRTTATVVIPAAQIPPGDLFIDLSLFSKDIYGFADSSRTLHARVPFSAVGVGAGPGRYSLIASLAPTWARKACGTKACLGLPVRVSCASRSTIGYVNSNLDIFATLKCPSHTRAAVGGGRERYVVLSISPVTGHTALRQTKIVAVVG